MILCETCKTKCLLIDGEYICQEGHVSRFVQEMADDVNVMLVSKQLRRKKGESVFEEYNESYKRLLLYHLLFSVMAESLGLKSEKYFHYFVNFLSGDKSGVSEDLSMSFYTLVLLLYFTKRDECNDLILFGSFLEDIRKVNLKERIKHFSQLLVLRPIRMSRDKTLNSLSARNRLIERLALKDFPINHSEHRLYKETGFPNPHVEYNKLLFRKDLGLSLEKMMEYFRHLTGLFGVTVTSEMIFYFEKYVYMREYHKTVGIPEDEVCYFLFLYGRQYKDVQNYLIDFLGTTPDIFYGEVQTILYRSGCNGHDRFFCGTFFYQRHLVEKKFYAFENYLRRLKKLLKTKKNLRLKKEYIEANMV